MELPLSTNPYLTILVYPVGQACEWAGGVHEELSQSSTADSKRVHQRGVHQTCPG